MYSNVYISYEPPLSPGVKSARSKCVVGCRCGRSAFVFVFCYIFFFYNFIAESQIHINLYNTELMRRNLQYLQRCLPIFLVHSVRLNPNFIIILCEAEYCHSIKKPFFFGFFIQ